MRRSSATLNRFLVVAGGSNLWSDGVGNKVPATSAYNVYGLGTIGNGTYMSSAGVTGTPWAVNSTPSNTTSINLTIGALGTGSTYVGRISWVMFIKNKELSSEGLATMHSIYKETIGSGLNLP